jgi:replication factor A1
MEQQKISELQPQQGNVNVTGVIKEKGELRTFNKYGRELKLTDALLEDDSGSIKLTLWNDDVDKYNEGDKVEIINGYVNEFQGEKQLTSGKFGQMKKVDGTSAPASEEGAAQEAMDAAVGEEAPATDAPKEDAEEAPKEEAPKEESEEMGEIEEELI